LDLSFSVEIEISSSKSLTESKWKRLIFLENEEF
jgi:hypothetical protein